MPEVDVNTRCRRLIFGVEKSIRYHRRHAQFIETSSKIMTFVSALAGTGVVASIVQDVDWVATALGFTVAIMGTAQLVFNLDGKVRENVKALEAFTQLRQSINDCPSYDTTLVSGWENLRSQTEAEFISELDALNVDCHNQLLDSRGDDKSPRYKITRLQRLSLHIFSWQRDFPEYRRSN